MRHRNSGRQLNRNSTHRKAMFKNMAASLFDHEVIRTTVPRANELRRVVETLITLAKDDNVASRRLTFNRLRDKAAANWELGRMAAVDRNALRIGCYELLYNDEIPTKVAINEAIELGKRFSTKQSGSFINGILDRIRREQGL